MNFIPSPYVQDCPSFADPSDDRLTIEYRKPLRQILENSFEILNSVEEDSWKKNKKDCLYHLHFNRPIFRTELSSDKRPRLLHFLSTFPQDHRAFLQAMYLFLYHAKFAEDSVSIEISYGAPLALEDLYALVSLLDFFASDFMHFPPRGGSCTSDSSSPLHPDYDDEQLPCEESSPIPLHLDSDDDEQLLAETVKPISHPPSSPVSVKEERYEKKLQRRTHFHPYNHSQRDDDLDL